MKKKKSPLIYIRDMKKSYFLGKREIPVLVDVDLEIKRGEVVALMGPSGSGKSTLLNLIGVLDTPDSGEYILDSEKITNESDLPHIRGKKIGFVFQTFNLLPRFNALHNVEVPMIYAGIPSSQRLERAQKLLERVGLTERSKNKPNELSGGERQRVAIARALANKPSIILADEPTGNLDSKTGQTIIDLILDLNKKENMTVLMVTHEDGIAKQCQRIVRILDGKISKI